MLTVPVLQHPDIRIVVITALDPTRWNGKLRHCSFQSSSASCRLMAPHAVVLMVRNFHPTGLALPAADF